MREYRPSDSLTGMPTQFQVRSEAEQWQGAFKQAQGAIREQGEVMVAALDNNRSLWETNKKLRRMYADAVAACASMESERNQLQASLDAIPVDLLDRAILQTENEKLRAANKALTDELIRSMVPELDTEARRARLDELKAQRAELDATGLEPTADELALLDAKADEKHGVFNPIPGETPAQFDARVKAAREQRS